MVDESPRLGHFMLLILLAFVWGSSFILMKRALFAPDGSALFGAFHVGAMRIVFAGLTLLPIAIKKLNRCTRTEIFWMFLVGLLGNTIPAFLFTGAQLKLSSSMAGMLNSLTPLFTLMVAMALFGVRYKRLQLIGLFIGFAGAVGLIGLKTSESETHLPSALMVVFATLCYAFSVNIIRNKLHKVSPTLIAAGALGMLMIPCAIYLLLFSDVLEVAASRPDAANGIAATVVLGAVGTALALVVFNRIIQQTSALFASSVTYVIPVFAAMWGVLDHESLTWMHLVLAVVILSGVYLVNSSKKKL